MHWHTEQRKITDLTPNPTNPRQMTEKQVADLTESLKRFNLAEIPAINTDNQIISGHQRLRILIALGRGDETIDVRVPDEPLTQEQGSRCLRDLDLFKHWPVPLKVGATLTFLNQDKSLKYEPGAALPDDRIPTLMELHDAGVQTWASIEPVIEPTESLAIMRASLPFVDAYKIGKLNHVRNDTDWSQFLRDAVALMRENDKPFYVKEDLRKFCQHDVHLSPGECDMDALAPTMRPMAMPGVQMEMFA